MAFVRIFTNARLQPGSDNDNAIQNISTLITKLANLGLFSPTPKQALSPSQTSFSPTCSITGANPEDPFLAYRLLARFIKDLVMQQTERILDETEELIKNPPSLDVLIPLTLGIYERGNA